MSVKIAIVLGTRPEIIKMSPIIRACENLGIDYFVLHSGQHYDHDMDSIFFSELELAMPRYNLHVGSRPFGEHVGLMMKGMKEIFLKEQPDVVIVQGDTLTVLMGALAAKKWDIAVAHHEAGLRSHDITMPEEVNRILTDHLSEFLFCPTPEAVNNIKKEGLNAEYHSLSGNTIVDAVMQNIAISEKKFDMMKRLGLAKKKYILATAHRAENTNDPDRLSGIIKGLLLVKKKYPQYEMIFPMHPRTRNKLSEFGIEVDKSIRIIKPAGFLEFLQLEKNAALAITDSGGLQEECSILHTPVVTVRDNTERPETINAGMNILAGINPRKILACSEIMINKNIRWKNVFGDGHAGDRIVSELIAKLHERKSLKNRARWIARTIKKNIRK